MSLCNDKCERDELMARQCDTAELRAQNEKIAELRIKDCERAEAAEKDKDFAYQQMDGALDMRDTALDKTAAAEKESQELKAQVAELRESIDTFRKHYEETKGHPKTAAILWMALYNTPADSLTHWQERVKVARAETWIAAANALRSLSTKCEPDHVPTPSDLARRIVLIGMAEDFEDRAIEANPQEKPNDKSIFCLLAPGVPGKPWRCYIHNREIRECEAEAALQEKS